MDNEAARTVARETVQETFLALGVDMRKPGEVVEVQQDFAWTRGMRLSVRKLRMHAITVLVGLMATGVAWAVFEAVTARAGK